MWYGIGYVIICRHNFIILNIDIFIQLYLKDLFKKNSIFILYVPTIPTFTFFGIKGVVFLGVIIRVFG